MSLTGLMALMVKWRDKSRGTMRLAHNSLWMILSRFAAQGLAVVFTMLIARRLGGAGFGAYAFVAAIIFVANALTTFGTDMLLIREIAAKGDLSRLPIALVLQLVLSVTFIAAVWLFSAWIPNQNPETITALKIYSLALIPLAFFTVFTTALRGKQFMDAYALLNVLVGLSQVGVVLVLHEKSLILLASLLLSVQILTALLAGLLCSFVIPHFSQVLRLSSLSLSSIPSFLKAAAPIALLTLLGMIYQRLNIYLLSTMSAAIETGIYSAASRAVEASKTAHLAVFAALYPVMAARTARQEMASPNGESPKLYFGYLFSGAVLVSLSLVSLAKPLVILLYGNEFATSAAVLQILVWVLIPFTVNTYLTLSLLASNQERLVGHALTASLVGLLILNLRWIPTRGAEGSAWAALIAECIQTITLLAGARSSVRVQGAAHEFPELS